MKLTIRFSTVLFVCGTTLSAIAQPPAAPAQPQQPGTAAEVTVGESANFKPAFRIEPLVHHFEARRGKVIPFEFEIISQADSTLEIKPVAMIQQETGIILPDETIAPPEDLTITSQSRIELGPDEVFTIRGSLRVPVTNSPVQSFGILVKNVNTAATPVNAGQPNATRLDLRFVTQYLLRCDLDVLGARGGLVQNMKITHAELGEVDGYATAQVFVENPTVDSMTFGLRCRLRNLATGAEYPTFETGMPCRSNAELSDKYIGKILAETRLRMEAPIPHPLFVGDYELIAELTERGKVQSTAKFNVTVVRDDFPAQNRSLVEIVPGVLASPGVIELSLERGGQRSAAIELGNNRTENVTLNLSALAVGDTNSDWLLVRPEEITLTPGHGRRITIMLGPDRDVANNHYAKLQVVEVAAAPTTNPQLAPPNPPQSIMIGMIGRDSGLPELEAGKLTWDPTGRHPAFTVTLKNTGTRHLPLFGELVLSNADGQTDPIRAGFGRWLLPGETDQLRFRLSTLPPAGQYRAEARIYLGEEREPVSIVEPVQLAY